MSEAKATKRQAGTWPPAPPTCSTCGQVLKAEAPHGGHEPSCGYLAHVEAYTAKSRAQYAKIAAEARAAQAERRAEEADAATAAPGAKGQKARNGAGTMRITKRTNATELSVEDLKALATMLDVEGRSKMKKAELVKAIEKAQADLPEPGEAAPSKATFLDEYDGLKPGLKVVTVNAIRTFGIPAEATGKITAIKAAGGSRGGAQVTVVFDEYGEVKAGARHFVAA